MEASYMDMGQIMEGIRQGGEVLILMFSMGWMLCSLRCLAGSLLLKQYEYKYKNGLLECVVMGAHSQTRITDVHLDAASFLCSLVDQMALLIKSILIGESCVFLVRLWRI
jgi:hypothetical protein